MLHVDEVDHDEAGHVTQPQLAGDFPGGFKIGVKRGRLDPVLLGGAARVDVDRHQRLGRVDDQVAAGLQLHHRIIHRAQLIFGAIALEQRDRIGIGLHPPRVTGHQHFHEGFGRLVAILALDDDFLDFLVVDVPDRALDEVTVRMDQRRRRRGEGLFADLVPDAGEIVEVTLDLGLGAAHASGAHDQAHRLGQLEIGDHVFQALAIAGRADLAADPAAAGAVGHQHGVTAGKAQIGCERRALVAAFFLDDLDKQHLAALDDVLDLVAATQRHALGAHFVDLLGAAAAALAVGAIISALAALTAAATAIAAAILFGFFGGSFAALAIVAVLVVRAIIVQAIIVPRIFRRRAAFEGGDVVLVGGVDFLDAVFGKVFGKGSAAVVLGVVFFAGRDALVLFLGAQTLFFLGGFGFFSQQGVAVSLGDLIVVGMDFAEGKEAVAVTAEVDESCLQRRFDPGYLGEIDIAFDLLVFGRFKIEFFNPVALHDRYPGFFRVARVDEHAR